MSHHLPLEGEFKEGNIFSILYYIYKNSISGLLEVRTDTFVKQMFIRDRKIIFASSNLKADSFGDHLVKNHIIDRAGFNETTAHMLKKKIRFGRALAELGYLNYDQIWTQIQGHLQCIIDSFFKIKEGTYRIIPDYEKDDIENIVLDVSIIDFLVNGIRQFKCEEFLENTFKSIKYLYTCNTKMLTHMDLKPYEVHVFDLVKRGSKLEDIVSRSELLEFDTLKYLFLFLVTEVISNKRGMAKEAQARPEPREENVVGLSVFNSFEEALKHYNMKYELIYKTLSKEIGPISISLLLKAIEDIMENLPSYLQKLQLNSDGTIHEESLLKALWYHDFDKNIGDFLRGLEEILYTEIYTVKKHLGQEYEQQVLKWINGIGI